MIKTTATIVFKLQSQQIDRTVECHTAMMNVSALSASHVAVSVTGSSLMSNTNTKNNIICV